MVCSWIDAFVALDACFRSARFDSVGWHGEYGDVKLICVGLLLSVMKIYRCV